MTMPNKRFEELTGYTKLRAAELLSAPQKPVETQDELLARLAFQWRYMTLMADPEVAQEIIA